MRRYDQGFQQLRRRVQIHDPAFGQLRLLHCAHRADGVPGPPSAEFLIEDCLAHEFDQVRWITGQEIISVQVLGSPTSDNTRGRVEDPIFVSVELTGGISVVIEVNIFSGVGYEVRCEAIFDQGTVTVGAAEQHTSSLVTSGGKTSFEVATEYRERFQLAYDAEFIDWADWDCFRWQRMGRLCSSACH